MNFFREIAKHSVWALISILATGLIVVGCVYFYIFQQLPDVTSLKDVQFQVPLRVYTRDGQLISEYGEKRRTPVSLKQVPKPLIEGILATEDQRFFEHPGVDLIGLVRAAKSVLITGKKVEGASTITMQVARNFFLNRKKTYLRKINEILLALKIDSTLNKEQILELYLNKVYLGQRAYGVAAAAHVYYGKTLDQLTLAEMAMIAGLPQAPSSDNPISNPQSAKKRRDHVLARMYSLGYIDEKSYNEAIAAPVAATYHGTKVEADAPYVGELVRSALVDELGNHAYTKGLKVYTTIDPKLQAATDKVLHDGLLAYDRRHGYRGAEQNLGKATPENIATWPVKLKEIVTVNHLQPAAVLGMNKKGISAVLSSGEHITISPAGFSWARNNLRAKRWLKAGDVVRVEKMDNDGWRLAQLPVVEGAIVALDPKNGAILGLAGGFNYFRSHFNRVTQAELQPGSSFKPFIYAAALEKGFTLASIIDDSPVEFKDNNRIWRPRNSTNKFYGPTRLRVALAQSRNVVSVRLLRAIGVDYAIDYLGTRFGFDRKKLPHGLSLALGTADLSPLQMAAAYAVFANGGYKVTPYFIDHITDEDGQLIYQAHPATVCTGKCVPDAKTPPAPRVLPPDVAYLMYSALQSVINEGTGRAALSLKRTDLAGKTGTTNDKKDAWFSGFNNDIVTTVWVGFDQPRSLHEYGAQAALPIWIDFMKVALDGKPEDSLPQPDDVVNVKIDRYTGLLASPGEEDAIFEVFSKENMPTDETDGGSIDNEEYDRDYHPPRDAHSASNAENLDSAADDGDAYNENGSVADSVQAAQDDAANNDSSQLF